MWQSRGMKRALLALTLLACGPSTPDAEEPDDVVEAEPPATPGPTTPRALLEAIRDRVASGEVDRVRELVLDYAAPGGRQAADLVIEGIRTEDDSGDFAFSMEALEAAIERADEIAPPSEELAARLAGSFGRLDPRLADASRLRVFDAPETTAHILMVEVDGEMRLVFWESLTSLVGGAEPTSNESAGDAACVEQCGDDEECLGPCRALIGHPCGPDPEQAGYRVRHGEQCFTASPAAYCEANCGGASACTWQDEEGFPQVLVECGAD